jgi:hypothetical protein
MRSNALPKRCRDRLKIYGALRKRFEARVTSCNLRRKSVGTHYKTVVEGYGGRSRLRTPVNRWGELVNPNT